MVEEGWGRGGGGDFYAFESRAKVGLLSNQGKKKKLILSSMGRESCFWGNFKFTAHMYFWRNVFYIAIKYIGARINEITYA